VSKGSMPIYLPISVLATNVRIYLYYRTLTAHVPLATAVSACYTKINATRR